MRSLRIPGNWREDDDEEEVSASAPLPCCSSECLRAVKELRWVKMGLTIVGGRRGGDGGEERWTGLGR